jgi:hypothetical protein
MKYLSLKEMFLRFRCVLMLFKLMWSASLVSTWDNIHAPIYFCFAEKKVGKTGRRKKDWKNETNSNKVTIPI